MKKLLYFGTIRSSDFMMIQIVASNERIAEEMAEHVFKGDSYDLFQSGGRIYNIAEATKLKFEQAGIKQGYILMDDDPVEYLTRKEIINKILNEI